MGTGSKEVKAEIGNPEKFVENFSGYSVESFKKVLRVYEVEIDATLLEKFSKKDN